MELLWPPYLRLSVIRPESFGKGNGSMRIYRSFPKNFQAERPRATNKDVAARRMIIAIHGIPGTSQLRLLSFPPINHQVPR